MSMCSVIIWGVGMPWFKRRNQQKVVREKASNLELQRVESDGVEKAKITELQHADSNGAGVGTKEIGSHEVQGTLLYLLLFFSFLLLLQVAYLPRTNTSSNETHSSGRNYLLLFLYFHLFI
jgi:hypothetical protein